MGYEPITYCRHCGEPNDVYMSFEQRFCSEECEADFHKFEERERLNQEYRDEDLRAYEERNEPRSQ